jgi:hypothetical protein
VAVSHEVAPGEGLHEALVSPAGRACVVHDPDAEPLGLDDEPLGESAAERGLVHVPVNGRHGCELSDLVEDRERREVADVQDEVRDPEEPDAVVREAAGPPGEVRVPDDRDQGTPSRKRPSRYTSSPSA